MSTRRPFAAAATAIMFIAAIPAASGDAPCDKGFHDTTESERNTMTRILEAARRTLPPAPAGWVILGDDQVSVPGSICMDYERKPWSYHYTRYYQRVDKQEEIDEATRAAAALMTADMAAKQPRLDALTARSTELTRQQVAFLEKGEMARAIALNEQMAALQDQIRKVMDEGDAQQRGEALMQQAMRDIEMNVSIRVNAWNESPAAADATTLDLPGGAVSAARSNYEGNRAYGSEATVLFGRWRPTPGGFLGLVASGQVPANAVHGLSVHVVADRDRLESMLAAIDFAGLGGLVGH